MSVMHLNELSSTLTLGSDALSAACAAATSRHIVAGNTNKADTTGRERLIMALLHGVNWSTAPRPSGVSSVIPQTTPDFAPLSQSIVLAQTFRPEFFSSQICNPLLQCASPDRGSFLIYSPGSGRAYPINKRAGHAGRRSYNIGPAATAGEPARCPFRVKMRRTQREQIESVISLFPDLDEASRYFAEGPDADSCNAA